MDKIGWYITTTKHNEAQILCIIFGALCEVNYELEY